ncbi:hypothetical protein EHS25_000397 [Saitozyma podzolica]|uniref:Vacuolar-sorting protein SNF8 n=1 Tax=Saitozyma podzolica TaxID=1890683 RepID=A0A427YW09_9TREE|nr:hypothetical protein EHS25_000397 [Saitozyma podzolica]
MRKGAGISALSRHAASSTSYASLSNSITSSQLVSLTSSLDSFRDQLISFARQHRNDIRKDPAFRHQFQKMCAAIGVDPLAGGGGRVGAGGLGEGAAGGGGGGGWWTEMLGLGEWTYELAVQVVDVCVSTRERNGGVIEMGELIERVERLRSGGKDKVADKDSTSRPSDSRDARDTYTDRITPDDIHRALSLLRPLHAGYTILPNPSAPSSSSSSVFIRSIPRELDTDQSLLLVLAKDAGGLLREADVRTKTGWSDLRTRNAMEDCVMREGVGWVDELPQGGREVWIMAAVVFGEGTG